MLQISNIKKEYKTGTLVQRALDGVSLNLRDNEFVAILGPSGSGKTTLLNVIGGLDRYDSGDLVINGVSTKKYSDRDWDSYRNHSVGFVFQSYNLIPHQNILANVELALTISGISKAERRKRAADALIKVGLEEHMHKRPNQLSGGQMQRVAIARALVNDPDILLADEPTGALDSDTSVQVMDLLKEVARDRLVVMVTHNPELAEKYATRIVTLKDGRVTSDNDPFAVEDSGTPAVHRNLGKASMGFATALGLSFNNLRTKLTRTILVAFAGSIGIIGIALILSLSNGVDRYIKSIEEDTLREYPIMIENTSFDSSTLIRQGSSDEGEQKEADVKEAQILTGMFSMLDSNDLASLKEYIESGKTDIYEHARAIEYNYNVTPQIYRKDGKGGYRQINPDKTMDNMGFSYSAVAIGGAYMNSNVFHELPENEDLYISKYEVKAGHWPEKYNECVLVLTEHGYVSDMTLYALGFKDADELDEMVREFAEGNTVTYEEVPKTFEYEDFIGVKFKLVKSADYYQYDETYNVWTDKSGDEKFVNDLAENGEDLTIVGVIQPAEGVDFTILSGDIYYTKALTDHLIDEAAEENIVKAQLVDRKINVITGKPFGEDADAPDLSNLFSVDEDAMASAFNIDTSALSQLSNFDMGGGSMPAMEFPDIQGAISRLQTGFNKYFESSEAQAIMITVIGEAMATQDLSGIISPAEFQQMMDALQDDFGQWFIEKVKNGEIVIPGGNTDPGTDPAPGGGEGGTDPDPGGGDVEPGGEGGGDGEGGTDPAPGGDDVEPGGEGGGTDPDPSGGGEGGTDPDPSGGGEGGTDPSGGDVDPTNILPPELLQQYYNEYLQTERAQAIIAPLQQKMISEMMKSFDESGASDKLTQELIKGYEKWAPKHGYPTVSSIQAMMRQMEAMLYAMTQMPDVDFEMPDIDFENMFSFDADAFAGAFSMNMNEDDLRDLFLSMMNTSRNSYAGNLAAFGYADRAEPYSIYIFAKSFESKDHIKEIIEDYNNMVEENGEEDKRIIYTDIVGALMSSVTSILNAISYVLIAFVSISLVVSSIMIGVITYISVLERRKEIGILRAIGASKRNISQVFNAETFIIGALAGLFGVGISLLLLIPGNALIAALTDNVRIRAALPAGAGVTLIILSIILTLIGGIIPSRKAAKSDPVTALRTE